MKTIITILETDTGHRKVKSYTTMTQEECVEYLRTTALALTKREDDNEIFDSGVCFGLVRVFLR